MDRFEIFRQVIEKKKRKGEEKKPRYGTRKLSVGLVSCVTWRCFSSLKNSKPIL